ncbi:hypothetical protein Tco_0296220 [Tanacetum coccineum]
MTWKASLDRLPTRANLVSKGVLVPALSCPSCNFALKDLGHLLFSCDLAIGVARSICRWWNLNWTPIDSYASWLSWFKSLRLSTSVKGVLEGVFYTTWWSIWNFRNLTLFAPNKPRKDVLFDDIVMRSYTWCSARFLWDEGFFVGYSINSKAFRVFKSRTRIVEENLHVQFSENTPNIVGSGPNWLFDIDALTKSINYKPVIAGNQSNGNAGTKACDDRGDDKKKVTKEPGKEGSDPSKEDERDDEEKDDSVNNTNNVNAASTNEVNDVGRKVNIELPDDQNMSALEDIVYSDDDEDVGAEADMNNLDAFMHVSPIPTIRVHKDHLVEQIIGDLNSAPQPRRMTKNLEEHGLFSSVQQRTNNKDFQKCFFACFLSQVEPKKVKTINEEVQLQALVDGKKVIITESTVRRDLHLEDAEGVDCLPNPTIFEQLTLMGYVKLS